MKKLSTLLENFNLVSEAVFFVKKKITNAGLTARKGNGPEIITTKSRKLF